MRIRSTRQKRHIGVIGAGVSLLALAVGVMATVSNFSPYASRSTPVGEQRDVPALATIVARADEVSATRRLLLEGLAKAPLAEDDAPPRVRAAVEDMVSVQGLYTQAVVRARRMDELLSSPANVAVLIDTVASEAHARAMFGEMQAHARYLAIRTLERGAQHGDRGPLEAAWRGLSQDVAAYPTLTEGRLADVRDAAFALVSTRDVDELRTDTRATRSLLSVATLPADAAREVDYAVFTALAARIGRADAATLTESLLSGT